MKGIRSGRVVRFFLLFALPVVIGGVSGIAVEVKATRFGSNGDFIQGWYWLRDPGLRQYAEWTFTNIPPGTGDLIVEITALATNRASGGRGFPARFRLVYGVPADDFSYTMEVTLPNVSPPNDPVGYTCKGRITIPRAVLHGAHALFLRAERISPTDNHVAFNKDSVVILASGTGWGNAATELQAMAADNFRSNGDLIQGIYWCRRQGQFLEWTWNSRPSLGQIDAAAVNFELLVTNKANGGSGWGATVRVILLDLKGSVIATDEVELVNPFRPQFPGDSRGIGYKTYGVYVLPDPNLVRSGFRIRIAWPPIDGSGHHFGGARERALLAVVVKKP